MGYLNIENIKVLLSILGAIQALILAIVIWFYPREHKTSNLLLSIFILSVSHLLIINRIAEWTYHRYDYLLFSFQLVGLIALYLYIKSLYSEISWKKQWWHIPILIFDTIRMYVGWKIRTSRLTTEDYYYQFFGSNIEVLSLCSIVLIYGLYLSLSWREYKNYLTAARKNFSDDVKLGTSWVQQMILWRYLLILVDLVLLLLNFSFMDWYAPFHGIVNTVAYTVFAYYVTIKGKLNPAVYQLRKVEIEKISHQGSSKSEFLKDEKQQEIADSFLQIMREEKLYKMEGLTIRDVADRLNQPAYLVSQAINTCLEKSFFELVNGFRVEEAKILIVSENTAHLSMVGIAFEAGFSSKTAFNTVFKKYTGVTPTVYKKNAMELNHN